MFAIRCEVEVLSESNRGDFSRCPKPWFFGYERTIPDRIAGGHQLSVLALVDEFRSGSGPDWGEATVVGDLPFFAAIRVGAHVDLVAARFGIRVGQPMAVRREGGEWCAGLDLKEGFRLFRFGLTGIVLDGCDSDYGISARIHFIEGKFAAIIRHPSGN